jgi:dTMP kinase
LTLLFDVDAETGLRRRMAGGGEWNRLDDYALAFHQRVQAGYRALAAEEPGRVMVVDAARGILEIEGQIRRQVAGLLAAGVGCPAAEPRVG